MAATRYYYDSKKPLKPFSGTVAADNPAAFPAGDWTPARPEFQAGMWPCWDGAAWRQAPDNRGAAGWVGGAFFEMHDVGPLPEGFSLIPPETPEDAQAVRDRERGERLRELDDIDARSARALRALALDPESEYDRDKLAALEARAVEVRRELAEAES
jgi:hypothetical protein